MLYPCYTLQLTFIATEYVSIYVNSCEIWVTVFCSAVVAVSPLVVPYKTLNIRY